MKVTPAVNEDHEKLQQSLMEKEKQERLAVASTTSEILTKLNISVDNLPQKCQQRLLQVASLQAPSEVDQLDSIAITLHQSREMAEKMEVEYEILKLNQKDQELQLKIDRNTKVLESIRKELEQSKESLAKRNPNPGNVAELTRQLRQKAASYEESAEKARAKFTKLSVPEHAMPAALRTLATGLAQLCADAAALRARSEDIALARQARDALHMLRR